MRVSWASLLCEYKGEFRILERGPVPPLPTVSVLPSAALPGVASAGWGQEKGCRGSSLSWDSLQSLAELVEALQETWAWEVIESHSL